MCDTRFETRMMSPRWLIVLLAVSVVLPATAENPLAAKGLDAMQISAAVQDELAPTVAFGGEVAHIAWEYAYSGTDHDVYFALVDAHGIPVGGLVPVVTSTRWEGAPAVAYSESSETFLLVWEERNTEGDLDVLGHLYGLNGSPVGDVLEIAAGTGGQRHPAVAWGDDTWLVAWEEVIQFEPSINDLRAIRLEDDGTVLGRELVVASGSADESAPAAAWGGNRFMVAWQDAGAGEYDIAARTISTGGTLGGPVTLADWEYDQIRPSLAYSPESQSFLVVWEDHHWGWGDSRDIYSRRVNSEGSAIGGLISISWEGPNHRTSPAIAYDSGNGEFQIVWVYEATPGNLDLYRRRVSAGGVLLGPEVPLAELTTQEAAPAIAGDGSYGYLVAWEDSRNAMATGSDLWAEFFEQFRLSGRAHEGAVGNMSQPLPGVEVQHHCSGSHGILGELVASTVTDPEGWWGLPVTAACDFHQIWMVTPEQYEADGATSVDGEVLGPTFIEYEVPLGGKVLTGNRFFALPQDPPPEPWTDFAPTGWWTSGLSAPVSAQISDGGSGLDVSTAEHRFSRDGGAAWSAWEGADCTGSDGSNGPETVSGVLISEGDSSSANLVQFAISDLREQRSESLAYTVRVDTTPPDNPPEVGSNLATRTWYGDNEITLEWQPATDATSGVAGYSFAWSTAPSTIPDTSINDQDNHIEDTIPGDGQSWFFHLRAVDQAGNAAVGAVRRGPFWLDTAGPVNPSTVTCSPPSNAWTASSTVNCTWDAGADSASGVGGYSYLWDTNAITVPDGAIDTTNQAAVSPTLASGLWNLHLRTVDAVGNPAVATLHHGPFRIDRDPPDSSVDPLAAVQTNSSFGVSWGGSDGSGSGIISYEIRVEDQTAGTTETFTTPLTSGNYNGTSGHTYLFASSATDLVGNVEPYPLAGGDAITTVGVLTPVRVRDETGSAVSGARVYLNGSYAGTTNGSGLLELPYAAIGDTLAATHEVFEHTAAKPHHGNHGSGNWDWRVYQTSWGFDSVGNPQLNLIEGSDEQVLIVRADQPLIGIHHITSIEFDASTHFTYTEHAIRGAADLLYDATDGQMVFEVNEIFDNGVRWVGCDMQIHASTVGVPNAHVNGIDGPVEQHMNLHRANPEWGWATSGGVQVIVHEFGHYGLALWDEYRDRTHKANTGASCASNRNTVAFESRSSIMDRDASEFCSRVDPNHQHMTNTAHDAVTGGETTWESIVRKYADDQDPPRWVLQTPDDRGSIMAGPGAIPINIVQIHSTNAATGACPPFDLTVRKSDGTPAGGANVSVLRTVSVLPQGQTASNGTISIVGAHVGTSLLAGLNGETRMIQLASCSAAAIDLAPSQTFRINLVMSAVDGDTIEVSASWGDAGTPPSVLRVAQEGTEATELHPSWDPNRSAWAATMDLDPALERTGRVDVRWEDSGEIVAAGIETFSILPLATSMDNTRLMSNDGALELMIPAASMDAEAWVTVHSTDTGTPTHGDLLQVGRSYGVHVSSGQASFDPPVVMSFGWDDVSSDGVAPHTIELFRWDPGTQTWAPVGGTVAIEHDIVSVEVDRFSVFGAFGKSTAIFSDGFEGNGTGQWSGGQF